MKRLIVFVIAFLICGIFLAGAWGPGSFENDDALDWVHLCAESKNSVVVGSALETALQPEGLQAPEGAAAIAAAEVVAAAKGKPSARLPKEVRDWLNHQPKEEIAKYAPLARKALVKVKDPSVSELAQIWKESTGKQWASTVAELETRLK